MHATYCHPWWGKYRKTDARTKTGKRSVVWPDQDQTAVFTPLALQRSSSSAVPIDMRLSYELHDGRKQISWRNGAATTTWFISNTIDSERCCSFSREMRRTNCCVRWLLHTQAGSKSFGSPKNVDSRFLLTLQRLLHTSRRPSEGHPPRPVRLSYPTVCRALAAAAKLGQSVW